jgi:hypothetical protein
MAKSKTYTRNDAAASVARSLREFGYPDATTEKMREVLDAWLDGKRDDDLPHGILGMFAGRQFEDVEAAKPGTLASLPTS